jgi:uncharacterized protein YndB with AHSA1/START domain
MLAAIIGRLVAEVDLTAPAETTFQALTDAELYSRWLQVPVRINGGEFAPPSNGAPRSEDGTSS